MAATSDRNVARLEFQSASVLIAESVRAGPVIASHSECCLRRRPSGAYGSMA